MAGVRNGCIARGTTVEPGFVLVYTVPPDHALLLKSVLALASTATATNLNVFLQSADTLTLIALHTFVLEPDTPLLWEGWTALNAGDLIQVYGTPSPASFWIAGAVLPGSGAQTALPLVGQHTAVEQVAGLAQQLQA